jgi:hypothetical protein
MGDKPIKEEENNSGRIERMINETKEEYQQRI